MKFSMKVNSDSISTIEGMEGWVNYLQDVYGVSVKEFSISFKSFLGEDHPTTDICMIGNLMNFINLWKHYHKSTTVKIGW